MEWTSRDTAICKRAEASGMALNGNTGKPLTFGELKLLSVQYDKVRSTTTVDEFLKNKITSVPFDF